MAKKTTATASAEATERPTCETCRYHVGLECHRSAPGPMSLRMLEHALGVGRGELGLLASWPLVRESDFCGEHRERGDR